MLAAWSKVSSFEGSDQGLVRYSTNGTSWTTLQTLTSAQSDNTYRFYDLAIANPGSTLFVRFDAAMSAANDLWYIDDVQVTGTQLPGVFPNDPGFASQWWLHNTGQSGGIPDADIDAPETDKAKCASERALGDLAKYRLAELLAEAPFSLEGYGSRDRDQYGRLLRVVYQNGRSVGQILVAEGLARPWQGRRRPWC